MTLQSGSEIGRSRIQRAFIVLETTRGNLAYPAAGDFILVANDSTISQSPEYTDSPEKTGTRDIIEQFANAMPPANGNLSMVLRPAGLNGKPQGYDALLSLFGNSTLETVPVFTLGAAGASDTSIPVASGVATLPPCGVIQVDDELIYYDKIVTDMDGSELAGCVRGYDGTAAAAISEGDSGTYKSICFIQDNNNPSFSFWLQTDHFLQAVSGCTINAATFSVSNEGPVMVEFTDIQGMEMTFAGTSALTAGASLGATKVTVVNPKSFKTGIKIWSPSENDYGASGYTVTAVNDVNGEISISPSLAKAWANGAAVAGYLPQNTTPIGEPIEGVSTKVFLDGVQGKMRTTSLTYNNNIDYLTDEVGTEFPEDYVENARGIELAQNVYFRKSDAERFKEGYEGTEVHERFSYGNNKVILDLPRVRQTMPTPTVDGATVSLDINGTVLGADKGNNSVFLILN